MQQQNSTGSNLTHVSDEANADYGIPKSVPDYGKYQSYAQEIERLKAFYYDHLKKILPTGRILLFTDRAPQLQAGDWIITAIRHYDFNLSYRHAGSVLHFLHDESQVTVLYAIVDFMKINGLGCYAETASTEQFYEKWEGVNL